MQMAIEAPERVKSLSLYSTFSHVEPYLRRRYEILVKILLETTPELWAMFTAFSAFGEDYINAHDAEIEKEVALRTARWRGADAPSKIGLLGHYQAILGHEVRARLAEIRCPTWIAVGSSDPVAPPSYAHYLRDHIAGARLSIYPGAPHRLLNFTPQFTGTCLIMMTFGIQNNTAGGVSVAGMRYGTGTAPNNGAAQVGTTGPAYVQAGATVNGTDSTTLVWVVALTVGTTYWFDLAIQGNSSTQTVSVSGCYLAAVELA